ncbi:MAG: hypothetical protein H0T09_03960, partial [Actinobacteria bacterium]|nr:hypothetical protein [Actinomycetota bacterium]
MRTIALAMASRRRLVLSLALLALATAAALSLLATRSQAGTPSTSEISTLKAQLADAQRDARFWQQLTS